MLNSTEGGSYICFEYWDDGKEKCRKYYDINKKLNLQIENMFKFEDKPDVVIFGHIHSPILYRYNDKTLVNPGSVSNGCDIIFKNEKLEEISSYMIIAPF